MRIKLEKFCYFFFASAVIGSGVGYSKFWLFHLSLVLLLSVYVFARSQGNSGVIKITISNNLILFCFFYFWYTLSILWSINTLYSLYYLYYLAVGLIIMIMIVSYAGSESTYIKLYTLFRVMFIIAMGIGLLELFTSFRLPTSPYSEYAVFFGRKAFDFKGHGEEVVLLIKSTPTSFWWNPNNFAVAMVMLAPFLLIEKSVWNKYIGLTIVVILTVASGSRGALISLLGGLIFYSGIFRNKQMVLYLLLVSIVLIVLAENTENQRAVEVVAAGDALMDYVTDSGIDSNSIGIRRQLIKNGLDALWLSNGLGVGAGGSQAVQESVGGVEGEVASMHNFWIELLVDGGFIGFSLFIAFYMNICFQLMRIVFVSKLPLYRDHAKSLFMTMVIFSVGCISMSSAIYFLPMWIMLGMSIALIGLFRKKNHVF